MAKRLCKWCKFDTEQRMELSWVCDRCLAYEFAGEPAETKKQRLLERAREIILRLCKSYRAGGFGMWDVVDAAEAFLGCAEWTEGDTVPSVPTSVPVRTETPGPQLQEATKS